MTEWAFSPSEEGGMSFWSDSAAFDFASPGGPVLVRDPWIDSTDQVPQKCNIPRICLQDERVFL